MTTNLNLEDLNRILKESKAIMPDVQSTLETWGIDLQSLYRFCLAGGREGSLEYETDSLSEAISASLLTGFLLGFRASLEIEMRRESSEEI